MNDKIEKLQEVNPERQETSLAAVVAANEREQAIMRKYGYEGEVFNAEVIAIRAANKFRAANELYLETGKDLTILKECCNHGEYLPLVRKYGFKDRDAQNLTLVFEKFGSLPNTHALTYLNKTNAVELARILTKEQVEVLSEGGEVHGKTTEEYVLMSSTELAEMRKELNDVKKQHQKELEGKDKHADHLAKQNRDMAKKLELRESGADHGHEFVGSRLDVGAAFNIEVQQRVPLEAF